MMIDANALRARGLRLTPQRRMILTAIAQSPGHTTAEEIHRRVLAVYPNISISTVYRNLERLMKLHLVAVTDMGGDRVYYEVLGKARHHHLICRGCGRSVELRDGLLDDLRSSIARDHGFSVSIDHLALWGLCSACRDSGHH